jgi:hypothetical protein
MFGGIISFILFGIVGAIGVWLIILIIRKFFKVILAILLGFIIFIGIGFFFSVSKKIAENKNGENEEISLLDSSLIRNDENSPNKENQDKSTEYIRKSIRWSDYSNVKHSFNYRIEQSDYEQAKNNRSTFLGDTWGEIYNNLYQTDRNMLSSIYRKYDSLKTGYDALEFARVIVSSVQEVPYTWILTESCESAPNATQIQSSGYKCLGDIKNYAVLSPAEFMVSHKGDCDTKAMVLYTILKRFNYDVCILISEQYEHAMLGINIPASGKYVSERGTRYYVWETTVKGMDVGLMPPEFSNLSFWSVAL